MSSSSPMPGAADVTIVCLASYYKGTDFLNECRRQGCRVLLVTSQSLEHAAWPRQSISEFFYVPDVDRVWNINDVLLGLSHVAKTETIDRIVALDEFDVETAAILREHLRIPGMGQTTARYFRDKLAMRTRAAAEGLPVPAFLHVLNHRKLNDFMERVPPPWVLKPRSIAGSIGVKKLHNQGEFWDAVNALGDQQSYYLLEQFIAADVYHVDAITYDKQVLFSVASKYGRPPMEVSQSGDVFTTRTLAPGSPEDREVAALNQQVLRAFGLQLGASHSEFIRARDGKLYFLETAARVGGAHINELVEASTGVNLWAEWAKTEIAGGKTPYSVPPHGFQCAGLLISLARQEWPDTSAYNDPEIVWRMNDKSHHVGLIVRSPDPQRVEQLVREYAQRFHHDFFAYEPPRDRPTA